MHTQIPLYIGITQYNKHYQWRLLVSYAVYSERRQRDKGGREVSAQKFKLWIFFLSFFLENNQKQKTQRRRRRRRPQWGGRFAAAPLGLCSVFLIMLYHKCLWIFLIYSLYIPYIYIYIYIYNT